MARDVPLAWGPGSNELTRKEAVKRNTLRRVAALALGTLAVLPTSPLAADEQQPRRVYRVGLLGVSPPSTPEAERLADVFRQVLREHGFVEGWNLLIERRYTEGRLERFAEFAAEHVRSRVDVIYALGSQATLAAARATTTIPIVFWRVAFPVDLGLASSLARPGGNVTGIALWTGSELMGKQLELLKKIAPKAARVAWISSITTVEDVAGRQLTIAPDLGPAARTLGMQLHTFPVRQLQDFDVILPRILESRVDAVGLVGDALTWSARERIVEFANRHQILSTYGMKDFALEGGLLSYGSDITETVQRGATYLARVLRGSTPADLPIERPTKFELVINLRTAKTLGLTIPQSLLVQADQVIE